jgi:hypothetical protein
MPVLPRSLTRARAPTVGRLYGLPPTVVITVNSVREVGMAFTDHCDLFASFHEDGFNRIVRHIQLQRPSLFNYATATLAHDPRRLCEVVQTHPIVGIRNNPIATIVDLLPVPGTDFGLDFCVQLRDLKVDFHPGNTIALPPELRPLNPQRLALGIRLCAGIACPPTELLDRLVPPPVTNVKDTRPNDKDPARPPLRPLPFRELRCFCLEAFATAGVRIRFYGGKPYLEPFLEGFEIVDIEPKGLENAIECYIATVLRLSVLPGLRVLLEMTPLDIIKDKVHLSLGPMPSGPQLPNNPALEDDLLEAFVKVEVI